MPLHLKTVIKQIQMIGKSGEPVPSRLGASRIEFVHDGGRNF